MALSHVGYASAATTSATLPAFNVGDLAIVFAYRDGSNTPPSLPAGWTDRVSTGGASNSYRIGYRILVSGDTTTGVWTNATEVQVLVLRGQHATTPMGTDTWAWSGTGTSITYQAPLTLDTADGSSWVVGMAGHRTATDVLSRTVAGMTNRSSGGSATSLATHTEQVASWPTGKSFTVNASAAWRTCLFEVRAAPVVTQTGTAEISVAAGQTPTVRTDHQIVLRARKTSAAHSGTIRAQIFEGTTAIGTVLETSELTTSLATYTLAVATADAEDITSYANLTVKLYGYSAAGTATVFEVASLELRIPASASGTKYGAIDMPVTFGASTSGIATSGGDKDTTVFEVSLASGDVPNTRTNHRIVVRARKTNGAHTGTIRAQLWEGTTPRSAEIESSGLTTSLADYTLSIADADAATIGSYSNLSVRIRGYASTGDATVFEVAQVSLLLPVGSSMTGSATLASFASVSVGESSALLIYPNTNVFPHALATVSATATITATSGAVYRYGSVTSPFVFNASVSGQKPNNPFGAALLASTATIAVVGNSTDRRGIVLLASTATVTVSAGQDIVTAAAALASTATITVGGDFATPPAPPGFTDGLTHMPDMLVAVAFASQPLATIQDYTAVTAYTREHATKRGRQFELNRTEAGNANLLLDNLDGRFNPENTASPYYPNLKPTKRLRIAAAWNSVIYELFNGFLEGYPQEFPHVGFDRTVRQGAVDAFMALALARFIPGTTTLQSTMLTLDTGQNDTGRTSQTIGVGSTALPMPQNPPFEITIDADRPYAETMTVTAITSAFTYTVERENHTSTGHSFGATVTTDVVSFGEELSGTRIQHVLNAINVTPAVSIAAGQSLLAASENLAGQAPLEHLQLVAEAEQGRLFVSKSGVLTFQQRHHFYANELANRAVFGDGGGAELEYEDVKVTHDDEKLFNIVRITPASGNTQEARDTASIADHFERVLEKEWPLADDNEALDAANFLLARFSRMQTRIPEMVLNGSADPADLWPVVLGLELGQRYGFKLRPRDGSQMIDKTVVVEGVAYSANPNQMKAAVQLSLADTTQYWQLGVAGKSELGSTTRLAY